uniref:hypothetical protein n=1 Tax=Thaumasiovibrio occultus TaxID=1891184 RepID=UPI000B35ECA5|nr:hypothetical protein [Thaumasiovibrio occultus]
MLSQNPFTDPDRREIWEMLVTRDINAYCNADWSMVEDDFIESEFYAVDAGKYSDPGNWKFAFSTLAHYRDVWVSQARIAQDIEYAEPLEAAVHRITTLEKIEIADGRAIARKQFNGTIKQADGNDDVLLWQTLYYLKKTPAGWKICGFTGYLPYTA